MHKVGSLTSYWILPESSIPVLRTTVQNVTYLETCTDTSKQRLEVYYKSIKYIFQEKYTEEAFAGHNSTNPTMEMLSELAEDDKELQSEFNKVFDNPAVKEVEEEFTPDFYGNYGHMELTLYRGGDRPEFARVKKRLKDANGRPIGVANENPIMDSIMYEVKYRDGYVAAMASNVIAENLFSQVNQEVNIFLIVDSIIDTRTNGTQILQQDAFVITKSGNKRRKNTTKGWEVCIQWKYGSTIRNKLKYIKDSYPLQMAEYAVENIISEEPAFAWRTKHVMNKRDQIISKTQRYWVKTHKYGLRVTKSVKEAFDIDQENVDTLWWDAIMQGMKMFRPAFEGREKRK